MQAFLRRPGRLVALVLWFAFLIWANLVTPFWGDDYCRTADGGLSAYFSLALQEYLTWSGRFFAIVTTYFVLGTGRTVSMIWFDIANAGIFLGLVCLVVDFGRWASGKLPEQQSEDPSDFLDVMVGALMLWWLPREIGEVALWKTGSIAYLWPATGEMLILARTARAAGNPPLWLAPLAFVIAGFLEPAALIFSVILFGLGVYRWRMGFRVPALVAASHVAGMVFLLISPGNFLRAAGVMPSPLFDRIVGVIGNIGSLFDLYWLAAVILIAVPFVAAKNWRRIDVTFSQSQQEVWRRTIPWQPGMRLYWAGQGWIFLALALMYMCSLLIFPRSVLAARVSFPASVFLVCYLISIWHMRPRSPVRGQRALLIVGLLFALHCVVTVHDLVALAKIDRDWRKEIQPQTGKDAVLPLVRVGGRIVLARKDRFFEGLSPNPANFINVCYARVMGVHSVRAQ